MNTDNSFLNLNIGNRKIPKFIQFVIKNKKILILWYLLIFGLLFLIGFILFLYSGVGNEASNDVKNLYVEGGPSHNGVWFIEKFFGKTINGTYITGWDNIANNFYGNGKQALFNFFEFAEILHTMYISVLPIWIVGLVFLAIYMFSWLITKLLKKLLMKKISKAFGNLNKDVEKQINIQSENMNLGSMNEEIEQIIKNAKSADDSHIKIDEETNNKTNN